MNEFLYGEDGVNYRPNSINGRLSKARIEVFREFGLVKVGKDQFGGRWRFPNAGNS